MALSSKSIFKSSISPFSKNQDSKSHIKLNNHIKFKSNFTPENWTITQDNTSFNYHTNKQVKIEDDFGIMHERKMKTIKHMLRKDGENVNEIFGMTDAIQRLGIDHYFQDEIGSFLKRHCAMPSSYNDNYLHEIALRFRLLRQEGFHVPAEVFDQFKDEEGKWEKKFDYDIRGLMELYEASQLSIVGENALDEAGDYSYKLLNWWMKSLDRSQAKLIDNTLAYPHHKTLPRLMANKFSSDFRMANMNTGWMNDLQELAKFDFKMVQSQYQHEILQISRWWTDLGLSKELKFARNQPLKWYIWSMATLSDPNLSEQRIDLTKPISFIYIIDDIFDVYGTLDELILFTQIIDRWDINALEQLPEYMRICFKALDIVTNEIGFKVYKKHGWNPVDSLRKTWGSLCKAFLVEARWFAEGDVPNTEEYLQNGIVSSGVNVVLVHIFYLLGHAVNCQTAQFVDNHPLIESSAATILRLWDDLGSAKDENQDGNDGSYIECYMKEYKETSVEIARQQVIKMISDAWKQLNQECLFSNSLSPTFTKSCLNLARMVPLMYNYDENQRLPALEHRIKALLYDSASM